jgi:hypothetical protein
VSDCNCDPCVTVRYAVKVTFVVSVGYNGAHLEIPPLGSDALHDLLTKHLVMQVHDQPSMIGDLLEPSEVTIISVEYEE